jgi:glutaconate CoA-transferase subunit B
VQEIRDNTSFDFDLPERVPETSTPDATALRLARGVVSRELAGTYPLFAAQLLGRAN